MFFKIITYQIYNTGYFPLDRKIELWIIYDKNYLLKNRKAMESIHRFENH